jgi:HD-GYP domain-containing protein (c-di-GMP phosphodiesterase class II)
MNDGGPGGVVAVALDEIRADFLREAAAGPLSADSFNRIVDRIASVPRIPNADGHVRLAFEVVMGSGHPAGNYPRGFRFLGLLDAAWDGTPGTLDPQLERRWHSVRAIAQIRSGWPAQAARSIARAFVLATSQNDPNGKAGALTNLAMLANGAGQYEDAVRFATAALSANELSAHPEGLPPAHAVITALRNRANALYRLGRVDEALRDFLTAAGLHSDGHEGAPTLDAELLAVCAQIYIAIGSISLAECLLERINRCHPPEQSGVVSDISLAVRRARALLDVARQRPGGLEALNRVLHDAQDEFDDDATDGAVVEALYALELAYRLTGRSADAAAVLEQLRSRLRSTAERALDILAADPALPPVRSAQYGLSSVDEFITQRVATARQADAAAADSLQQLVALSAQASSIDEASGEHGIRVAALAREVATALGLDERRVHQLVVAALVHDAGRFGLAPSVREREAADDAAHAADGASLVERSAIPDRQTVAHIVRLHHAPLFGADNSDSQTASVPFEARILAACDRFDAMVMGRPGRPPVAIADALRDLMARGGKDLDATVTAAVIDTVRRLQARHADLMAFLAEDAERFEYTSARRFILKATGPAAREQ